MKNTTYPQFLSITEMAKLRNVSTETLRHYDRIGLLKPDYTDKNGMRFYSISKYEKLQTIKELKQIGMKLKEIHQYFQNRNFQTSYDLIKTQNEILNKKISQLKKIQKQIQQKKAYMQTINEASYNTEIFIKKFPNRYYISSNDLVHNETELSCQLMQLENLIYESEKYSPLYATERYAALIPVNSINQPSIQRKLMIFIDDCQSTSIDNCEKIPGGIFCCARGVGDFWHQHDTIHKIFSYFKKNHIKPDASYMIENVIVDHSITDVLEERLYEFQIKIIDKI